MKSTYICDIFVADGTEPKDVKRRIDDLIVVIPLLGGGREKPENWWLGPSVRTSCVGVYFNGEVSVEECEAWKVEFEREARMTVWRDTLINDDAFLKVLMGDNYGEI